MRATVAVLRAFLEPLSLERVEIPPLEVGQVLVQVAASGVCGSDVHMWRGKDPRTPLTIILGHEGVGWVLDSRDEKCDIHGRRIAVGDLVLWERGVTCGQCYYCVVRHEPALCTRRWAYGIHRSMQQPPHLNGCYATHMILDAGTHLIPLPPEIDPAVFVAASCSGATAAHGFDLSPAKIGDTVVIMGPGPLGAFSVLLAKASGAEQIVVVGGTASRLAICQRLGATLILDRHQTTVAERLEWIRATTQDRGADLVVEASGSGAAAREGLDLLRYGGTLSLVGFGTPVGEMNILPFESVVRRNARIQGVWVSDAAHTLRAISLVRANADVVGEMVTGRFPLQEATRALQTVAARETMKAVLLPNDSFDPSCLVD